MSDEQQSDIAPREYQSELVQYALKEDTIVHLPTGSGKTYIAALVIKEKASETIRSLNDGGKRTVFLVPTIALAIQQAEYLRRHTPLRVKEYYGGLGIELDLKNKWRNEFENNQVLVMTAQTFVTILNHAFFTADKVNVLVFDECHAVVRDSPMKQVLKQLSTLQEEKRPRVLGLTATLFRKKCAPHNVMNVVQTLAAAMKCNIRTPTDINVVYRNCTNPCQLIVEYSSDLSSTPNLSETSKQIKIIATSLAVELDQQYNKRKNSNASKSLMQSSGDILDSLESFGIYGAHYYAEFYLKLLPRVKLQADMSGTSDDVDKIFKAFHDIKQLCDTAFASYSDIDRLLSFVHPKVLRLLEFLRKMSPAAEDLDNLPKMCAIVFVYRRSTAYILVEYLKEICKVDPSLNFVRPLYTIGRAAGRSSLFKESIKQSDDIMSDFRSGVCNLLVATSVLEEGIDIPACNLIIKFDPVRTYCDYVQAKGRARAKKAYYVLMVSDKDSDTYCDELLQYHSIEQTLMSHQQEGREDGEIFDSDEISDTLLPAYTPRGDDGPRISAQKSVSLVSQYCAKLPAGMLAVLTPQWELKTVEMDRVPERCLLNIREALEQLPKAKHGVNPILYQYSVKLPLNSPLKQEVFGDVMPSKRLAKRSAALRVCRLLHRLQELDDEHLLPKKRELAIADDDESDGDTPLELRKIPRPYPEHFRNCRPLPGQKSYVYSIDFQLIEPNEATTFRPEAADMRFGILTSKPIPPLCRFPLFTEVGKVEVNIGNCEETIVLDEEKCTTLESFHKFLFQDVIYVLKEQRNFDLAKAKVQCLLIPLDARTKAIDYEFAIKMIKVPEVDWNDDPPSFDYYDFNPSRFHDAVVVPWIGMRKKITPHYVDSLTRLTPLSVFSRSKGTTYSSHFLTAHNINITNREQNLIKVTPVKSNKNIFLSPQPVRTKQKTTKKRHFVPELCHVHPMPGSVWRMAAWIPSVLHRLYEMLVAEEVRVRIHRESSVPKIGVERLPDGQSWEALTVHFKSTTVQEREQREIDDCVPKQEKDSSGMNDFEFEVMYGLNGSYSSVDSGILGKGQLSQKKSISSSAERKEDDECQQTKCEKGSIDSGLSEESSSDSDDCQQITCENNNFGDETSLGRALTDHLKYSSVQDEGKLEIDGRATEQEENYGDMNEFELEIVFGLSEDSGILEESAPSKKARTERKEDFSCQQSKFEEVLIDSSLSKERLSEHAACQKITYEGSNLGDAMVNMSLDTAKQAGFGPSPGQMLHALSLLRTNEGFDMERLETLGDSVLKLITTIYVYGKYENLDDGLMARLRMKQISNRNLTRCGMKRQLAPAFLTRPFNLEKNFLAPGFLPPDVPDTECNPYEEQDLTRCKSVADVVESLIGLYLITNGMEGALRIMEWLGLKALPACDQCNPMNGLPLLKPDPTPLNPENKMEMLDRLFAGLENFEELLAYKFKNKELLIEALTHPSHTRNRLTRCYDRLEFLGDAVLGYVVTRFFYENPRRFNPDDLTCLRIAMVNKEMFAVLAVRNSFHRYLKHEMHTLAIAIDRFVRAQEANGHSALHDHLRFTDVDGEMVASNLNVPPALGNIFGSVAGAVFIDSGMSLDAVWGSYFPFLRQELEKFAVSKPHLALRKLTDIFQRKFEFKGTKQLEDGRWIASLEFKRSEHIETFKGIGYNLKLAKYAAAKYAISAFKENSVSS